MMHKLDVFELVRNGTLDTSDATTYLQVLGPKLSAEITGWSPATVGECAYLGRGYGLAEESGSLPLAPKQRTSLYEMHLDNWLNRHLSGHGIVRRVAVTTIAAAIKDLVDAELDKAGGNPLPGWMLELDRQTRGAQTSVGIRYYRDGHHYKNHPDDEVGV